MLDAHAHAMQVKLCKANTRGVTLMVLTILVRQVLLRVCKRSHYSRISDVYRIVQKSNENSKEPNALKHGSIA